MTTPLGHDFPLMSALSTRPPASVPLDEQRMELAEEERQRKVHYPRLVREGRMSQAEADRHFAILHHIALDCAEAPARPEGVDRWWEERTRRHAGGAVTWEDKVRELRRELAIRRNRYPRMIARLAGDERDLAERMERLEAVHFEYWVRLQHVAAPADEPRADFRDRLRRLAAARDHWVAAAQARRDPSLAGWAYAADLAAWYRAGGREQLLRQFPDIAPPAAIDAAA